MVVQLHHITGSFLWWRISVTSRLTRPLAHLACVSVSFASFGAVYFGFADFA
jgi:hypothetical protein